MAKYQNWQLIKDEDQIVWLHFDRQGSNTNVLSLSVFKELSSILNHLSDSLPSGLIVLSDKPNGFIAGADINEFTNLEGQQAALEFGQIGQQAFNKLAALSCPTLSCIHGFCLGGGLELSLACDYRIALDDSSTRIGLPEVLLGIHPGWGGTVRLPALIGVAAAMDLMLSGRTLNARKAKKLGIVDRIVPQRHLHRAAKLLLKERPIPRKAGKLQALLNRKWARPLVAHYLYKQLKSRTSREHYPAPYAIVDLWKAYGGNGLLMLQHEAHSVANLAVSKTAVNLIRVFHLQEQLKSLSKVGNFRPQHVHVIGAGIMGGDIAAWCAYKGFTVTLEDQQAAIIAAAIKRGHALFKKLLQDSYLLQAAKDRLIPDEHGNGIQNADLVIEAIIEDKAAKHALYQKIEPRLKKDALLATNTSSIPLDELGEILNQPQRLVGIHFFNPVAKMRLVEIVHGSQTLTDSKDKATAFCHCIDRLPLPVKSSPGFLINRILMPYLMEAIYLLEEGVPAAVIDKTATDFGMPMGPILLADTVGLDICLSVADVLSEALGRTVPSILQKKVANRQLGLKSGRGFYRYKNAKARRSKTSKRADSKLCDRLILQMLNEAMACLREGVVDDPQLLDVGMIFGVGFPPFRGGPMHYSKQLGKRQISNQLMQLSEEYGQRFRPDSGWESLPE